MWLVHLLLAPSQLDALNDSPASHEILALPVRVIPIAAVEIAAYFFSEPHRHGIYFSAARAAGTIWSNLYQNKVWTERLIVIDLHRRFQQYRGSVPACEKTLRNWGNPFKVARRIESLRDESMPEGSTRGTIIVDSLGPMTAAAGENAVAEFYAGITTVPHVKIFTLASPTEDAAALGRIAHSGRVTDLTAAFPGSR